MIELEKIGYKNKSLKQMLEHFNKGLPETLYKTHYQLAAETPGILPNEWSAFITDNEVSKFITSEINTIVEKENVRAVANIARAENATDVSKGRELIKQRDRDNIDRIKEIKIYMHPREVKELQDTLKAVRTIVHSMNDNNWEAKTRAVAERVQGIIPNKICSFSNCENKKCKEAIAQGITKRYA